MKNNLLELIKKIIAEQGEDIFSEPRRVSAIFADIAHDVPKPQKNAFIKSLEYGFAQALKNTAESKRTNCKQQLAQKLHEEEGLDLSLCRETLDLLERMLYGEEKEKIFCQSCKKELQEEWKLCPYCSTPLNKKNAKINKKKTPAKTKPATAKKAAKPVEAKNGEVSFLNLFDAFAQNKLPFPNGYIISSFFSETTTYSIYEIVFYIDVKEIYMTRDGLQFIASGKKLYILVEPDNYPNKFIEPVRRTKGERIEKRFTDMEILTARNQTKIMVAKEPNELKRSFVIPKPTSINFSVIFYERDHVYDAIAKFFGESLNRQCKVLEHDAKAAAKLVSKIIQRTMSF